MLFALPLSLENELCLGSLLSFQWSELGLETSLVVLIIKDERNLFLSLLPGPTQQNCIEL